jgi:hypothetical protein
MIGHDAQEEFAALIGRVTMYWNDLQYSILSLFEVVLGTPDQITSAVFFSLKSDAAQRDMVQAVFATRFASDPKLVTNLGKLMERIGKASGERNAAIHTAWSYWTNENKMGPAVAWVPHKKLSDDPKAQFEELCVRIQELDEKLWEFIDHANMLLNVGPSLQESLGQATPP